MKALRSMWSQVPFSPAARHTSRFLRERRAQLLELSAGQSTKKEKEEAAARIFHAVATFHEILGMLRACTLSRT